MTKKIKTIDLRGNEYAQVKDRVLQFREDNPRGSIQTNPMIQEDGSLMFRAYIIKDKADKDSADATGHAHSAEVKGGEKQFEKLETVAVGRALALLGYSTGGEIASAEEMEEFENWQEQEKQKKIAIAIESLEGCKTLDELKGVWVDLDGEIKPEVEKIKAELKTKLSAKETEKKPEKKEVATTAKSK